MMSNFAPRKILTKPIKEEGPPDPNAHLEQLLNDTKIMGKVNQAHRESFAARAPTIVEHCLRLTVERLQAGLDKRGGVMVNDPKTWVLTAGEIKDLSIAAANLHAILQDLK